MPKYYVVDTNVAIAADDRAPCTPMCAKACRELILAITRDSILLVLDDAWRIIAEYQNNLNFKGQPGVAQTFLKWVLTNRKNPHRCICVNITPKPSSSEDFEEFPPHPDLTSFDAKDRKFVAVAAKHHRRPPIAQATDNKWWGWKEALLASGIKVHFLCEEEVREHYEKKFLK
jgi:hypothetical protein